MATPLPLPQTALSDRRTTWSEPASGAAAPDEESLRLVFALVFSMEDAWRCLDPAGFGEGADGLAVHRCPSTVHRALARAALLRPSVYARCADLLDVVLDAPPVELMAAPLAATILDGGSAYTPLELASALWWMVNYRRARAAS